MACQRRRPSRQQRCCLIHRFRWQASSYRVAWRFRNRVCRRCPANWPRHLRLPGKHAMVSPADTPAAQMLRQTEF
ncbi:hypothetical protein DKB71_11085 [Pseudomonas sp. PLMAX]